MSRFEHIWAADGTLVTIECERVQDEIWKDGTTYVYDVDPDHPDLLRRTWDDGRVEYGKWDDGQFVPSSDQELQSP